MLKVLLIIPSSTSQTHYCYFILILITPIHPWHIILYALAIDLCIDI